MKLYRLSCFAVFAAMVACNHADQNDQSKKVSAPASTVMLVPLDKFGNELTELAEMRTVDANVEGLNSQQMLEKFQNGKVIAESSIVENANDALDESSTESWCGWRKRARRNACGAYGYCQYQPTFVQYGQQVPYYPVTQVTYCGVNVIQCAPMPTYRVGYQDPYDSCAQGRCSTNNGLVGGYGSPYVGFDGAYHVYGWQRGVL